MYHSKILHGSCVGASENNGREEMLACSCAVLNHRPAVLFYHGAGTQLFSGAFKISAAAAPVCTWCLHENYYRQYVLVVYTR